MQSEDSIFKKASSDDDDDDSIDFRNQDDGRPELKGRARWLKKTDQPDTVRKAQPTQQASSSAAAGEGKAGKTEKPALSNVVKRSVEVITEEILDKRITDYMASRGRRQVDQRELLRQLEVLAKAARKFGPKKEIPVVMHLISAMYEAHHGIDDYMELHQWRNCYRYLMRITTLLNNNPELVLGLMLSEDVTDLVLAPQINSDLMKRKDAVAADDAPAPTAEEEAAKDSSKSNIIRVVGNLEGFVARLEDEYTKSLQQINPHTQVSNFSRLTFPSLFLFPIPFL